MPENVLKSLFLILLLCILARTPAFPQTNDFSHGPIELGAALGLIGPVGDFRDNIRSWSIKDKQAVNLDLIMDMHRSGSLRLRLDVGFGNYKYDYGFRWISLGAEAGPSKGPILPYINAGYEWLAFDVAGYPPEIIYPPLGEKIEGGSGLLVGGGARIPIGSEKRWALDIGLRYHHGGMAAYLPGRHVQSNPDGTHTTFPTHGPVRFMMFTLGFQWRPFLEREKS